MKGQRSNGRFNTPMSRSNNKGVIFFLFVLFLAPAMVLAQAEQTTQQEEEQTGPKYTAEEYVAYQKAISEPDLVKREDAIVGFIKAKPESALVEYAIGDYLQLMQQYQNKGDNEGVFRAGEKMLTVKPDNVNILSRTTVAAFQLQQYQKAIEYGEKVYAQNPEPGIAFILAISYGPNGEKNEAKEVSYAETACAKFTPKDCYMLLPDLTLHYANQQKWAKAASYANSTLEAFKTVAKPATTSQADWDNYLKTQKASAYLVLGRQAYESGNYQGAIKQYLDVLDITSSPAPKAEASYYLGLSHWKQGSIQPAMEAFARGSMQKVDAPYPKVCREQLETLYKSTHNGSLAGIEEFLEGVQP